MNREIKQIILTLLISLIVLNCTSKCIASEETLPTNHTNYQSSTQLSTDTKEFNETNNRRKYIRFKNNEIKMPVVTEQKEGKFNEIIDISRCGLALSHNGTIETGEIIPVKLIYKDIIINTEIKITSSTQTRAGGEFINLNKTTTNQLLYLNILLEADNNKLSTKLSRTMI